MTDKHCFFNVSYQAAYEKFDNLTYAKEAAAGRIFAAAFSTHGHSNEPLIRQFQWALTYIVSTSVIVVSPQFTHVVYAKLSFCQHRTAILCWWLWQTENFTDLHHSASIWPGFASARRCRYSQLSVRQVQRLVRLYRTDGATRLNEPIWRFRIG